MNPDRDYPAIILTTDFGVADPYVGVMKGVILGLNPRAAVVDLTHGISPQNVRQGAFILGVNHRYFPQNAIHVAVVDPGVGTDRLAILVQTPRGRFLAPDNGILSNVVWNAEDDASTLDGPTPLPTDCTAYRLTEPQFWLSPVSATFHGRDVFAPAAAHLSLGVSPHEMGRPVSRIFRLAAAQPSGKLPGMVLGEVIYQDSFGNLVTNIDAARLTPSASPTVQIKTRRIHGLSRTFHDGCVQSEDGLIALFGSHGYLEIAVRDASAARRLQAGAGEPVKVTGS